MGLFTLRTAGLGFRLYFLRRRASSLADARAVLDREGARSTSDLAAAEHVRPQSMAQTVSELEGDGLISRRPGPADGRRALLELSARGLEVLEAERREREGWLIRAIVEGLSEREQQALALAGPLLRRLADS